MRFRSDRRYRLPFTPTELWSTLVRVEEYPSWWPWLRRFDGEGLVRQARWQCVVQPPLPYAVRFEVSLDEVRAPHHVAATISGDVVGEARLEIRVHPEGSEARLTSSLEPSSRLLRAVGLVASPVARFGHDWVLDTGAQQFLRRSGVLDPDRA